MRTRYAFDWPQQALEALMVLVGIAFAALATYGICSPAVFAKWNVALLFLCSFLVLSCARRLEYWLGATNLGSQQRGENMKDLTPKRKRGFVWETLPDITKRFLWCDERHLESIKALEGVASTSHHGFQPCYTIGFDPRYDTKEVVAAIEAIIMGRPDAQEEV